MTGPDILDLRVVARYSPSSLTTMLSVFESDLEENIPLIRTLNQRGEFAELARVCHRTRSGCLVIGATMLAEQLGEIEKTAMSADAHTLDLANLADRASVDALREILGLKRN